MSQEQVERLEALLTRVQANRRAARTIAGMPSPAANPPVMRAAPADAKPVRAAAPATAGRPAAAVAKPAATEAAARAPSPAAAPRARAGAEAPAARAPEPAVSETPAARARDSAPPVRGSRSVPPQQPAVHSQPPNAEDAELEPNVIEPEPIREPARPIAQVVSRHAPQADATFGAMLKRSLSLRPH